MDAEIIFCYLFTSILTHFFHSTADARERDGERESTHLNLTILFTLRNYEANLKIILRYEFFCKKQFSHKIFL